MMFEGVTTVNGFLLHVHGEVIPNHLVGRARFFTDAQQEMQHQQQRRPNSVNVATAPSRHRHKSFAVDQKTTADGPYSIQDDHIDNALEMLCSPPSHLSSSLSSMAGLLLSPHSAKKRAELRSLF